MKKFLIFLILSQVLTNLNAQSPMPSLSGTTTKKEDEKPNILFICVDDLRPELGCYGSDYIKSPNLDKLAASGVTFTNHFVQVPTCGASRCSMLTGMLPATKTHLTNEAIRKLISGKPEEARPETFIHHLRRSGYYTVGIGKISHYADGLLYDYSDPVGSERELPHSWDELVFDAGKWKTGWNAFFGYANGENRQSMDGMVKPYEGGAVDDEGYADGLTATLAIQKLQELKQKRTPFFLGVGFFKPHLPFTAPTQYWKLYNEEEIPLTPFPDLPANVNSESLHNSGEFNGYKRGEEKASLSAPLSEDYSKKIRHAYFASISYVDAQIGRVLNELERLGMANNTIIVVWGDHGWHLGDHRVWGKHTLSEQALRGAFIIKASEIQKRGSTCDQVVSAIDIYPTLMELCGVAMPHKTDGQSLVPLLKNPDDKSWNSVAYGYFKNGITMRTDRYRFTRYVREEKPVVELYDHKKDPHENNNIAGIHQEIIKKLMPLWRKGDTGLY